MLTVMRMTLKEMYRKKVFALAVVLSLVFLGIYAFGLHMAARDFAAHRNPLAEAAVYSMLAVMGVYLASFLVNFLTIVLSVGLIAGEIETGTIQALVAAPVRRRDIVLGKFLGCLVGIAVFSLLLIAALLEINYLSTGFYSRQALVGALTFTAQPVILLGLCLLSSCLFPSIGGGVAVFILYIVSIIGGIVEQVGVLIKNTSLVNAGIVTSLILPVDALYRKTVELILSGIQNPLGAIVNLGPFGSMSSPSKWMMLYAAFYLLLCLWGSISVFRGKDL